MTNHLKPIDNWIDLFYMPNKFYKEMDEAQSSIYLSSQIFKTQNHIMIRFLTCVALIGLLFSCNNNQSTNPQGDGQATTAQPSPATAAELPPPLPSVPLELLQRIFQEGTQVDYIYHYHPFTASLSEKPAIQNAIRHVAETPAPIKPGCNPAGIVTYQINGDIVLRADFYFDTNCTFFVFYDKDNNKYANYMTQEGVDFFNGQIQQALQLRNNMQQQ